MPRRRDDDVFVAVAMLATRIPKTLHHAVRLHCVKEDVLLMDFVARALEEKLARGGRRAGRREASR